jgi:hypothetical protein
VDWVDYSRVIRLLSFSVTGATLMRVPVARGAPQQLATSTEDMHGSTVDAKHVYCTVRSEVRQVPKAARTSIALGTGLENAWQIAQTSNSLHWTNDSSSSEAILRLAK